MQLRSEFGEGTKQKESELKSVGRDVNQVARNLKYLSP